MKKLKYITLLTFAVGLLSCEDDTYSIAYVDDEEKTALVGTLSATNGTNAFNSSTIELDYTIPQSFAVESTLEITLTSSFGVLNIKPNVEKVFITVPAFTTSGTATFTMPNFDNTSPFMGIPDFLTAQITGIKLDQETPVDDPFTLTSDPVVFNLFEFIDPWMNPNPQTLMAALDWMGPYGGGENDIDLYIFNGNGLFESSESGDRFEGDFFNNPANENHPDGDYFIQVAIWTSVDDTPIPWRLVLTMPDGSTDIYEGMVDPAVGFITPVGFTKTTDGDGNAMYETFAL